VGLQEASLDKGGTEPADNYTFFYGNVNTGHHTGMSSIFVHKMIISAVKRVQFVSDRLSYVILRGCWWDITVLNMQAPITDKCDDTEDSFYNELQCIFN
jgi:hypothetical protein